MNYEFSPWVICLSLSVTGVVLGAVFDFYRTLRYFLDPGKLITALGDLIYWTGVTALIFGMFGLLAGGEIRVYFFMFLALGLALYYTWLSAAVLELCQMVGRLVQRLFRFLQNVANRVLVVILAPFRWLLRALALPVRWMLLPWRRTISRIRLWWQERRPPTIPPET